MLVARRRHADINEIARFIAAEEVHHAGWFLKRQATQKQIVYQTEDCCVRTDGEGERNHGDDGEAWRFGQRSERVFEVRDHKDFKVVRRLSWLSHHFHSARSAITGSTRAARRAGSQHAIITAMPSTIAAEIHAIRFGAGISAH